MKFDWKNCLHWIGWGLIGIVPAQVLAIVFGIAAPEIANFAMIAMTAAVALGILVAARIVSGVRPTDHSDLIAAIDLLFTHFEGDDNAREAVRTVARAVTERRYHNGETRR